MTGALAIAGSSMTIGFENFGASALRVQLADSGNSLWCYTLTQSTGPVTIPLSGFNSKYWDNSDQPLELAPYTLADILGLDPRLGVAQRLATRPAASVLGEHITAFGPRSFLRSSLPKRMPDELPHRAALRDAGGIFPLQG